MKYSLSTLTNLLKAKPAAKEAQQDTAPSTVAASGVNTGGRNLVNQSWAGGYTPEKIDKILRAAEGGTEHAVQEYFKLADVVMEREMHAAGLINSVAQSVAWLNHNITPASSTARAKKIADDVSTMMQEAGALRLAAPGLISAGFSHGVGVGTLAWDTTDPTSWQVADVIQKPSHFVTFSQQDGRTVLLRSTEVVGPLREFRPGEALIFTPRRNSALQIKNGVVWVLCWAYLVKGMARANEAAFMETFGQPIVTGQYPNGADQNEISLLQRAVQNINSGFRAVYRDDLKIDFKEITKSNTDIYERVCRYIDEQTSKFLLASTLTTDAGSHGTKALGEVHAAGTARVIGSLANQWAATLQQLVTTYVVWNYGPDAPIPLVTVCDEDAVDLLPLSTVVKNLADAGVTLSAVELREKFGFREPIEGEDVIGGAPKPAASVPATAQNKLTAQPMIECAVHGFASPARDAIDDLADAMLADWATETQSVDELLLTAAKSAKSLDEMRANLLQVVESTDPAQLQAFLTNARTKTHLAGSLGADI